MCSSSAALLELFDSVDPKLLRGMVAATLADRDQALTDIKGLYGMVVEAKEKELKRALADLARARLLIANRILVEDGLKTFAPLQSTRDSFNSFRDQHMLNNGSLNNHVKAVLAQIAPRNAEKLQRDVLGELRSTFIHDVSKALHYEVIGHSEWTGWACGGHGIIGPTVAAILSTMQKHGLVPHQVIYVDETNQPAKVLTITGGVADLEDSK